MVNPEISNELVAHAKDFLLKQIRTAEMDLRALDTVLAVNPTKTMRMHRAQTQAHLEQLRTQLDNFNRQQ